jgi:hypothetical protein
VHFVWGELSETLQGKAGALQWLSWHGHRQ